MSCPAPPTSFVPDAESTSVLPPLDSERYASLNGLSFRNPLTDPLSSSPPSFPLLKEGYQTAPPLHNITRNRTGPRGAPPLFPLFFQNLERRLPARGPSSMRCRPNPFFFFFFFCFFFFFFFFVPPAFVLKNLFGADFHSPPSLRSNPPF